MSKPIQLQGLRKLFGATAAVDGVDLSIPAGDLFFLLGPSGCGKTTLLRMVAGFIEPTAGAIRFGDQPVTHLPANKRNCGMVFQSYALWPHMTVFENVAFGLSVRKVADAEKTRRVEAVLKQVEMSPYAQRKPNQLSGGQQQRVALARALVIEPTVLLLDEPLSNLDAALRLEMRSTIRQICDQADITAIYVTHDQKEALSMADGMAVLDHGRIIQTGTPRDVYDRPANRFVAQFLGETNILNAQIVGRDNGKVRLDSAIGALESTTFPDDVPHTGSVTCSIRPEAMRFLNGAAPPPDLPTDANTFTVTLEGATFLGEMAQHRLKMADGVHFKAFELNPRFRASDEPVRVGVMAEDVVILQD